MDTSMSSSTPTTITAAPPPLQASPNPPRDLDELSIASDFSIIPESLVEVEGSGPAAAAAAAAAIVPPSRTISTTSFLHSEDLQPSLTAMETHSKVTFSSIQATYYSDSDIAVTYTLGKEINPKSSDRIGLYKVGFTSPQDYLGYLWAPSPTTHHTTHHLPITVVFKASTLPKEVGEFFQFCYVTHGGHIVGVSAPFQLVGVGASPDVCVGEEEEGMVVVRSGESVLLGKVNELTVQNKKLQEHTHNLLEGKEETEKKLEEKTQQLNMCQHHLQALEVKMKRESSEKCELMGRVGQVVEEKGHLEERVKKMEALLNTEKNKAEMSEARVKELEEVNLISRKSLEQMTLSLRSMEDDLHNTKHDLKVSQEQLKEERAAREKAAKDLEIWTYTAEADQSERNSLARKFSSVNEELIAKLEELEGTRKNCYTLEAKLNTATKELEESRAQLHTLQQQVQEVAEKNTMYTEREQVLAQDNTHLQTTVAALKEQVAALQQEQDSDHHAREAAETIAGDLSGRLQAARAEYTSLAITNKKLARKLRKMRHKTTTATATDPMTTSTTSTTSSWIHTQMEENDDNLDQHSEHSDTEGTAVMATSCCTASQPSPLMIGSCCSSSTQQLSEAVNRKMEDIVRELSQQILSLKVQLEEKEGRKAATVQEEEEKTQLEEEEELKEEEEEEGEKTQETQTSSPYFNSFLRTSTTAPVFLPQSHTTASTTPTAPITASTTSSTTATPSTTATATPSTTATDPKPATRRHFYTQPPPQTPHHPPPTTTPPTTAAPLLPPPLLPETTTTARQAAVLSQFTQQQQQQLPPTGPPSAPPHDSDDDDFHSTDSDSQPAVTPAAVPAAAVEPQLSPQHHILTRTPGPPPPPPGPPPPAPPAPQESQGLMPCPLCSLTFPRGTTKLLEEHVNSHLEHVCPVCSEVFQRNCVERFQTHVQSHFQEEEEEEERRQIQDQEDPSGPWGRHLRNAHLLEID